MANAGGFVLGKATIGEDATAEEIQIESIAGNVLTLNAALANAHPATERVSMNWDDMATLGTGVATNYANKVASLTTPLAFAQAAGRVVQFGDIRLVGLYKLAPQAGAVFTNVVMPTTAEPNGKVNGLQKYQGDQHFSMAVDPANSAIIYLGGAIQPTNSFGTYTLAAAVAAPFGTSIKVNTVDGIAVGNKLVIGPGSADQETVQVSAVTAGESEQIRMSVAKGQTVVFVYSVSGFAATNSIIIEGGGKTSYGNVQSVKDNTATQTALTRAAAAGSTTLRVATTATFKVGDRILIFEGDNLESAIVRDIVASVGGLSVLVTTGANVLAPAEGLKHAYTTAAQVVLLSSITLTTEIDEAFASGAMIRTLGTVTLNAAPTLAHARGQTIRLPLTTANNADWTARLFRVDTATPANTTLIVASGASGGGWNGKTPSAPHGDSRSITFVLDGNSRYLVESDDGGIYRLQLTDTNGAALTAAQRKWQSLNGNRTENLSGPNAFAVAEANSVAYDPLNDVYFIGTQDAGSQAQGSTGALRWIALSGGDGNTQGVGVEQITGTSAASLKALLEADAQAAAQFSISLPLEGGQPNTGAGLIPVGTTATLTGGIDPIQAKVSISFAGANNDLDFSVLATATIGNLRLTGAAGDGISIQFVDSGLADPLQNVVTWDPVTKKIIFKLAPNSVAAQVQALGNTAGVVDIIKISLSTLDGGVPNTGQGKIQKTDLGRPARLTAGGKDGAAASAKLVIAGLNNDLLITATTKGTASNGIVVTFSNSASVRPGHETVVYAAGPKTLTFQIASAQAITYFTWRYSLGNNLSSFTRTRFDDAGARSSDETVVALAADAAHGKTGLLGTDKTFDGFFPMAYAINAVDPTRLLVGFHGLYESSDRGDTATIVTPGAGLVIPGLDAQGLLPDAFGGAGTAHLVSAVAYGNPDNANVIYAARGNFIVVRTGNDRLLRPAVRIRRSRRQAVRDDDPGHRDRPVELAGRLRGRRLARLRHGRRRRHVDRHHGRAQEGRLQRGARNRADREGRDDGDHDRRPPGGWDVRRVPRSSARRRGRGPRRRHQPDLGRVRARASERHGLRSPVHAGRHVQRRATRRRPHGRDHGPGRLQDDGRREDERAAHVHPEDHGGDVEGELDRAAAERDQSRLPRRAGRRRRQRPHLRVVDARQDRHHEQGQG